MFTNLGEIIGSRHFEFPSCLCLTIYFFRFLYISVLEYKMRYVHALFMMAGIFLVKKLLTLYSTREKVHKCFQKD